MFIDINEIERLHNEKISVEAWNRILIDINQNINQIIKNEYLKYKVNINIILNQNIPNDPNAYVNKINKNEYEIVIGRKLLILLNYYSYEIINYGLIFENIEKDERKISKIANTIFYFWVEFICLHEWSHIVNGHLDFEDTSNLYYEFNFIQNDNKEDIYFEIDADITAGKFLIKEFSDSLGTIKEELNEDDLILIENFHITMYYLFDLFFNLNGENIRSSHPSIFDRILLLCITFSETIEHKNDLFEISREEFKILSNKSIVKFVASHFREYQINKDNIMHEFMGLLENYFNFKKEMNFDKKFLENS